MKTTQFNISTKKGETQTLRFVVTQEIPFPDIEGNGSGLRWRNFGGLFKNYNGEVKGIGSNYICHLLAPGDVPEDYNRTHFAGYADYHDKTKVNGGTMTVRGRDLGEMTIHFEDREHWNSETIKVNGYNSPSNGERQVIAQLVLPPLREFIAANKAALREEAIAKIKARFAEQIKATRSHVDALEAQIETATY